MRVLTRPLLGDRRQSEELTLMLREIVDELEDLDVRPGQQFIIMPINGAEGITITLGPPKINFDELRRQFDLPQLSDPNEKQLGPFATDSETSRRAAIDNYPRQGTQRWRIIDILLQGGHTREEIARRTGFPENSVRPRVCELIEGGWVQETSETRKTRHGGSEAVVLDLTPKATENLHKHRGQHHE